MFSSQMHYKDEEYEQSFVIRPHCDVILFSGGSEAVSTESYPPPPNRALESWSKGDEGWTVMSWPWHWKWWTGAFVISQRNNRWQESREESSFKVWKLKYDWLIKNVAELQRYVIIDDWFTWDLLAVGKRIRGMPCPFIKSGISAAM